MVQDSPSRHQDQFVLRMPDGMRERIMETAKSNNRSMNSEIVAILEKAFLPNLSRRLQTLLDQVSSVRSLTSLTPSKVAELIGEARADVLEAAFAGKATLTFTQLDAIAKLWGVRQEWLKHGIGAMFPVKRTYGFTVQTADEFLKSKAKSILFLRAKSEYGELSVIIEHGNGVFETISTGMNISQWNGSGGEIEIARFSNACLLLWQEKKNRVLGYIIDEEAHAQLIGGSIYPGAVLDRLNFSSWIDNWWDKEQFSKGNKNEYWDGYRSFCNRIYEVIETQDSLLHERDAILSGKWQPL